MNDNTHIENIELQIAQENIALAHRLLLDAVYDTDAMPLYEQAIALVRYREQPNPAHEEVQQLMQSLLASLKEYNFLPIDENQNYLSVTDVQKTYPKGNFRLGPINLSVKSRAMVGLVGENGNGKTSLLRILARDLSLDAGELQYNIGVDTNDLYTLRSRIAYVPQRTPKWYGSLKDNLRFALACYKTPPGEVEPRMLLMIARLGLWKYRNLKWSELSSGYKMRFELARTLLCRPKLILLDEPLANLDIFSQQIILEDIRLMSKSTTHPFGVVLSSQQLYEVEKQADEILFLKEGALKGHINKETLASPQTGIILEIDCSNTQEELTQAFAAYSPKIQLNGGVYVLQLEAQSMQQVWTVLSQGKLEVRNVRDISKSARRFFS